MQLECNSRQIIIVIYMHDTTQMQICIPLILFTMTSVTKPSAVLNKKKKLNHQQLKVPWQFEKKDNSSFDQNNHSYKVKNVESKRQFWLHALLCTCIFFFLFCDSIVMKGFLSVINNTMDIDSKFICLCNFTTLATIVPLLWYDTTLTKVTNNFLSSHYLSCHKPPHMRSHRLWNTIK